MTTPLPARTIFRVKTRSGRALYAPAFDADDAVDHLRTVLRAQADMTGRREHLDLASVRPARSDLGSKRGRKGGKASVSTVAATPARTGSAKAAGEAPRGRKEPSAGYRLGLLLATAAQDAGLTTRKAFEASRSALAMTLRSFGVTGDDFEA